MHKRFLLPTAAIFAALTVIPPCVHADEEDELREQPVAVQKTAHAQIGSSSVEEVEPTYQAGQHATEVEYTDQGKKMAVVIAKDGTLIQKEYRMSPADAPAAIKNAVTAQYPGGTISHVKEVERASVTFYEVSVKTGGKSHQLKLDPKGKSVKED